MRILLVAFSLIVLSACGTTSGIKQTENTTSNDKNNKVVKSDSEPYKADSNKGSDLSLDLSEYSDVIVLDFVDGTKKKNMPAYAGRQFADEITAAIRGKSIFKSIYREKTETKALLISGEITRYKRGNAGLRLMVGFGAGSSYFDAIVKLDDNETGEPLGTIVIDKNSWVLGGIHAATQNVDTFMIGSAKKVSKRLSDATYGRKVESSDLVPISNNQSNDKSPVIASDESPYPSAPSQAGVNIAKVTQQPSSPKQIVPAQQKTTNYPSLLENLGSVNVNVMRNTAKMIGERKLYDDEPLNDAMLQVLNSAVEKAQGSKNKYYIDGLAWCFLNLSHTDRRDAIPVFKKFTTEAYPKKVRNHAIHVLKLWNEY